MRQGGWKSLWLGGRDFTVLAVYACMTLWALSHYEPWEDEGRAWLIARSFGVWDMLFHILRYEGHPALWYLLLWGPAHLHVPYVAINGISVAIGCAGIWVLLRYAPFPFWLRVLLPFGFWLGYEYALVARDYVLFPGLGFAVAHLYRRAPAKPVWMGIALGLLANSSIYGTLVAIGFAIAYASKLLRQRDSATCAGNISRDIWRGAAVFSASLLFVAVCVWPPRDLKPPFSPAVQKTFRHVIPASYVVGQSTLPDARRSSETAQNDIGGGRLLTRLQLIFAYPIAFSWFPSVALELAVLAFVLRRGGALLLLPIALLCTFMGTIYSKVWHVGMVWVTLVMLVWAAWDDTETFRWKSLQTVTAVLLAGVGAVQVVWMIDALRFGMTHSNYPAEATAKYLKTLPSGTTLDGNSFTFTILPYFAENPFTNFDPLRYENHGLYPADESLEQMVRYSPDVIVLRGTPDGKLDGDGQVELASAGYRLTHTFCGQLYFPNRPLRPLCFHTFERSRER